MDDNYLIETTLQDIDYLAPRLRKADVEECHASLGKEPREALIDGYNDGDFTFTLTPQEGVRVGLWGVCQSPLFESAGVIWMVATDELMEYQIKFLRRSRIYIELVQQEYPLLHNVVDARNELHIKWLNWMGFKFIQLHENYGVEKRPFYEFIRI